MSAPQPPRQKVEEEERAKAAGRGGVPSRAEDGQEACRHFRAPQPCRGRPSRPAARLRHAPGSAKPGLSPRKTDREREDRERDARAKAKGDDDRRAGKLTLNEALAGEGGRTRSLAAMKRKQEKARQKAMGLNMRAEKMVRDVQLPETIVVQELANRMAERAADVVKSLMKMGMMVTMNQTIDADTAELVIEEFGHRAVRVSDADVEQVIDQVEDTDENLRAASADRDDHGPRRPRQDLASGCDPQDQRRLGRSGRHHPAHRRLSGDDRQRCGPDLPRHAGPRGLHLDARPRRAGDGHRGAGGGGGRRRDAADDRGDQPRQGGQGADDRGDQQDRQEVGRSDQGADRPAAARGRRRRDVGRRAGRRGFGADRARVWTSCWKPSRCRPRSWT